MKKLLLIFSVLISINSFSQDIWHERSDSAFTKKSQPRKKLEFVKEENVTLDMVNHKINYTNYCLNKFRKEKLLGYCAFVLGTGLAGVMQMNDVNGTTDATETFNVEYASAGSNTEKRILATRKYESKMKDIKKQKETYLIAGSIIAFVGVFMQIDSYKWLRYAYVGENGIGIKIKLNK